jgi:hypothetical protein
MFSVGVSTNTCWESILHPFTHVFL